MTTENVNKLKKLASTKMVDMRKASSTKKVVKKDPRTL